MELELCRAYDPDGTNGELRCNGKLVCYTIELPWLQNQHNISCIPEGRYELKKRFVQKFGPHLLVVDVPDRSWILIHPANDAKAHLKGCTGYNFDWPWQGNRIEVGERKAEGTCAGSFGTKRESIYHNQTKS